MVLCCCCCCCGGFMATGSSSRRGRRVERRYILRMTFAPLRSAEKVCRDGETKVKDGGPLDGRKPPVRVIRPRAVLYQKFSLRPNCMLRGPRSLLSTPNEPLGVVA